MTIKTIFKKSALFAAAASLAFVMVLAPTTSVKAQVSVAVLQARIQALQTQLAQLMAQLNGVNVAVIPNACVGVTFSRMLVQGSSGSDVLCLQTLLNQNAATRVALSGAGSPGNETAFFGSLTGAALIKFQISNASGEAALDNAGGVVGTQTLIKLNSLLAQTTTLPTGFPAGCTSAIGYSTLTGQACSTLGLPVGCTAAVGYSTTTGQSCTVSGFPAGCTSVAGYSITTGQPCSGTITTIGGTGFIVNGQTGDFSATLNPTPADGVKVYAGENKDMVLGIQVRAIGSDISVQRVALDFNQMPSNFFTNIYLFDGSTLIASTPLNASTVSRLGASDYSVPLQSFQNPFIVKQGTTKVLMVQADVVGTLSSDILQGNSSANIILSVLANNIRAIDQSNTSLFDPSDSTTIQRTINVNPATSSQASLLVSRSVSSPSSGNITADTNGVIKAAPVLGFDVQSNGSSLTIDEIDHIAFTTGSGYLVPQTAYLYDSNGNVLASATPDQSTGLVNFSSLSVPLSGNTVNSFTIRVDDTLASNRSENGKSYQATVTGSNGSTAYFVIERPDGTLLLASLVTGTAQGYPQTAYLSGSMVSLQGVTTSSTQRTQVNAPTISATFSVSMTASGGNVFIPKSGAFHIYAIANAALPGILVTNTIYNQPSNTISLANSYEIQQGTTVTFTVNSTYVLTGSSANYYLALTGVDWGTSDASPAANTTDLMSNNYVSGIVFLQ